MKREKNFYGYQVIWQDNPHAPVWMRRRFRIKQNALAFAAAINRGDDLMGTSAIMGTAQAQYLCGPNHWDAL